MGEERGDPQHLEEATCSEAEVASVCFNPGGHHCLSPQLLKTVIYCDPSLPLNPPSKHPFIHMVVCQITTLSLSLVFYPVQMKKMFAGILGCPLPLSFIAKQLSTRASCSLFRLTGHPTGSSQNAEPPILRTVLLFIILIGRIPKHTCCGCMLGSMLRFQYTQKKPL